MLKVRKCLLIIVLVMLFLFVTTVSLYSYYIKPVSKNSNSQIVTIESNTTNRLIAKILKEKGLIKSDNFFLIYLKVNRINSLQAGIYKLNSNNSLKEIVEMLKEGKVYRDDTIKITFKEGINYREFARVIEKNTSNSYQDVMDILNNKEYLNSLIEDYWFINNDILNENIYYALEGYLFPDTYEFKNQDVTVYEIIKKLLDQMDLILSPYKNQINLDTYSIHELLTLASIAEKEVTNTGENPDNRRNVISVFVNRLNKKMSLGSDITTRYGLKLDDKRALTKSEYQSQNAYNTRNVNMVGLPPSPICMVSKESIDAAINRTNTNYLYFISNINTNETFFFETSKAFEAKKQELSKVNGGY